MEEIRTPQALLLSLLGDRLRVWAVNAYPKLQDLLPATDNNEGMAQKIVAWLTSQSLLNEGVF